MSQNGQTLFENTAAFAARFLKCVWPIWVIVHKSVNKINNQFQANVPFL